MTTRRDVLPALLGLLAVGIASTGTAVAATGQLVNIADGTNASRIAKVDSTGRLHVAAAGNVTSNEAAPSAFFSKVGDVFSGGGCQQLYAPPAGKSAVLLDLGLSAYQIDAGSVDMLRFFVNPTSSPCDFLNGGLRTFVIADRPLSHQVDLQAGVGIPAGWALYVNHFTTAGRQATWVFDAHGYTAPASTVPVPPASAGAPVPEGTKTGPAGTPVG